MGGELRRARLMDTGRRAFDAALAQTTLLAELMRAMPTVLTGACRELCAAAWAAGFEAGEQSCERREG